jgi:hypothetical protein
MAKPEKRKKARELRKKDWSIKAIVDELDSHTSSVTNWCGDIELTNEQIEELSFADPHWAAQHKGAQINKQKGLEKRKGYQQQGRDKAKKGSKLHLIGSMLYWSEGGKDRNQVVFVNSDPNIMKLFLRFLREELAVENKVIKLKIHCHTKDEDEIERIKRYWLNLLKLPEGCA